MDAQQQAGMFADGFLIIFDFGPVGGSDLPQMGAASDHNFRNSKRITDLNLLAPGGDDLTSLTQRVQYQKYRGSIVVDDNGGFAAQQIAQHGLDVHITLSA